MVIKKILFIKFQQKSSYGESVRSHLKPVFQRDKYIFWRSRVDLFLLNYTKIDIIGGYTKNLIEFGSKDPAANGSQNQILLKVGFDENLKGLQRMA